MIGCGHAGMQLHGVSHHPYTDSVALAVLSKPLRLLDVCCLWVRGLWRAAKRQLDASQLLS